MHAHDSLVSILEVRAETHGASPLYTYLDGANTPHTLTYAELRNEARRVAAVIREHADVGDRALLLFGSNLDFLVGLFACFFARVIAVPAMPLDMMRAANATPRLRAMASDARPRVVLCASPQPLASMADLPELGDATWVSTNAPSSARMMLDDALAADDVAFLQYTSGSIGRPRGVVISHRNLVHNQAMIQRSFRQDASSVFVSWLPLHHDMGLIGMAMQPLFVGGHGVFMSPTAFLKRPLRWLEAIHRYRATTSTSPNFGYDLCTRSVRDEHKAQLDLSCWRYALNGSETVRASTLERFAEAFAVTGFNRRAFFPCYGLAEATLVVTGARPWTGDERDEPVIVSIGAANLSRGRMKVASEPTEQALHLVGCGVPDADETVVIVDPERLEPVAEGCTGEIWVSSASVARGYWNNQDETNKAFGWSLEAYPGKRFLRTGDIGAVYDEQLFVTGRMKEMIIIRGRKHYPADLEVSVRAAAPALRYADCAAFAADDGAAEGIVVLVESHPTADGEQAAVRARVIESLTREHQVGRVIIEFVPRGTLPKTSSGKIQRLLAAQRFRDGGIAALRDSVGAGEN